MCAEHVCVQLTLQGPHPWESCPILTHSLPDQSRKLVIDVFDALSVIFTPMLLLQVSSFSPPVNHVVYDLTIPGPQPLNAALWQADDVFEHMLHPVHPAIQLLTPPPLAPPPYPTPLPYPTQLPP